MPGISNALASYDYFRAGGQGEDEIEGWDRFIHIENQPRTAEEFNTRGEAASPFGTGQFGNSLDQPAKD